MYHTSFKHPPNCAIWKCTGQKNPCTTQLRNALPGLFLTVSSYTCSLKTWELTKCERLEVQYLVKKDTFESTQWRTRISGSWGAGSQYCSHIKRCQLFVFYLHHEGFVQTFKELWNWILPECAACSCWGAGYILMFTICTLLLRKWGSFQHLWKLKIRAFLHNTLRPPRDELYTAQPGQMQCKCNVPIKLYICVRSSVKLLGEASNIAPKPKPLYLWLLLSCK